MGRKELLKKLQGKPALIFVVEKAPKNLEDALTMLQRQNLVAFFFDGEELLPPCCTPENLYALADKVIFAETWPPKELKLIGYDECFAFYAASSNGGKLRCGR